MLDPNDKELRQRTRSREATVWTPLLGGTPLAGEEERLNSLNQDNISSHLAVTDELYLVKEYEQENTYQQELAEIAQGRTVAEEKTAAERQRLALKLAAENMLYAARVFDAQVKDLIMAAREYANQALVAETQAEAQRLLVAALKEGARIDELNALIGIEAVNAAMVQADLAKAKVDVARAGVRELVVEAETAQVQVATVETQVQEAIARAEQITLQAETAMILAEILTKGISSIQVQAETAAIAELNNYASARLGAYQALWENRGEVQGDRKAGAESLKGLVDGLTEAEKAVAALAKVAAEAEKEVAQEERSATQEEISQEQSLYTGLTAVKKTLVNAEAQREQTISGARKEASKVVSDAKASSYTRTIMNAIQRVETMQIVGG